MKKLLELMITQVVMKKRSFYRNIKLFLVTMILINLIEKVIKKLKNLIINMEVYIFIEQ
jgi:hypothetical protein